MTLFTDSVFLTDDLEGFRTCRETRTTASATTTILLCKAGYIDVFYHGEMIRINKDNLFVRVPDFSQELGPYAPSPDFEFMQLTLDSATYEQLMLEHMRVEPRWWQKQEFLKEHPIFEVGQDVIEVGEAYFHLFALQLNRKQTEYRQQIIMSLARAASMEVLHFLDRVILPRDKETERNSVSQSDYTFNIFTHLLQKNPHQREVQWFAKQLNITPKYLSEICKDRSGRSAGEWIASVTVSELKHYLRRTQMPIREIARVIEFPNASFFCQYTKKHTGLTPNQFRKEKKA